MWSYSFCNCISWSVVFRFPLAFLPNFHFLFFSLHGVSNARSCFFVLSIIHFFLSLFIHFCLYPLLLAARLFHSNKLFSFHVSNPLSTREQFLAKENLLVLVSTSKVAGHTLYWIDGIAILRISAWSREIELCIFLTECSTILLSDFLTE